MLSFERQQLYHSKTKKGTNFVFQTPKVVFRATKVVSTIKLPCGFPRFPSLSVRSTHQGNHIEAPPGGPSKGAALRPLPPASGPRLGRSSAWGMLPPGPPGLRPLCCVRSSGTCALSPRGKRASGLSTPAGCGQRSRASIGRDPPPHGFFIKRRRRPGQPESGQAAGLSTVGRQCRAWVTHEPAGLSTPSGCGQVSYPCGDKA
jgi:hypothetical protein